MLFRCHAVATREDRTGTQHRHDAGVWIDDGAVQLPRDLPLRRDLAAIEFQPNGAGTLDFWIDDFRFY